MPGPMILVMEENATVRGVIQHALGRHGFSVEFATDCDQAHRLFEKHQTEFAVILLDIESGGLEFVNGIPTREPRIPVLFTATNSEHNLPAVAQQGFPCLPKPFKPETLINRLEQLYLHDTFNGLVVPDEEARAKVHPSFP